MNSISKTILFALASLFSVAALADTVCIKNKQGGIEVWQVADRNSVENAVPCPPQNAIKSPALQNQSVPSQQVTNVAPTVQVSATDHWSSSPRDLNMRNLIDTWSNKASWKLIWAVDKDIPLVSDVRITGDFKTAVRQLLDSTTLSDVSLKPCFYTNQVVRVVRETTKCNPNE